MSDDPKQKFGEPNVATVDDDDHLEVGDRDEDTDVVQRDVNNNP